MFGLLPNDEKLFSPLFIHKRMLDDNIKCKAFRSAIFKTVKKGDIVLDIGTGTGIMAFWAAKAGAKKVYAIEAEDVINIAKNIAKENGMSNKIIWINDISYNVTLPEKCTVLVTETIGNFGIDENITSIIIDAKKRLLSQNASIIPSHLDLFICPVENENIFSSIVFKKDNFCVKEFSYGYLENLLLNSAYVEYFKETSLLCTPQILTSINFKTASKPDFTNSISFQIRKAGTLHGFAGWFKARLSEGVNLSNPPQADETHWRQAFFPIKEPVKVDCENIIKIKMTSYAKQTSIDLDWDVYIENSQGTYISNYSTFHNIKNDMEEKKK